MKRQRSRNLENVHIDTATTFYGYLAQNVPNDVHFAMNRYTHYPKAKSTEEMENQMKHFVRNYGTNALNELAKVHPDRALLSGVEGKHIEQDTFLNATGGGCGCGGHSNASGDKDCSCEYFRGADGVISKDKTNCRVHGGRVEYANFMDKGSDYATLFVVGVAALMLGVYLKK